MSPSSDCENSGASDLEEEEPEFPDTAEKLVLAIDSRLKDRRKSADDLFTRLAKKYLKLPPEEVMRPDWNPPTQQSPPKDRSLSMDDLLNPELVLEDKQGTSHKGSPKENEDHQIDFTRITFQPVVALKRIDQSSLPLKCSPEKQPLAICNTQKPTLIDLTEHKEISPAPCEMTSFPGQMIPGRESSSKSVCAEDSPPLKRLRTLNPYDNFDPDLQEHGLLKCTQDDDARISRESSPGHSMESSITTPPRASKKLTPAVSFLKPDLLRVASPENASCQNAADLRDVGSAVGEDSGFADATISSRASPTSSAPEQYLSQKTLPKSTLGKVSSVPIAEGPKACDSKRANRQANTSATSNDAACTKTNKTGLPMRRSLNSLFGNIWDLVET